VDTKVLHCSTQPPSNGLTSQTCPIHAYSGAMTVVGNKAYVIEGRNTKNAQVFDMDTQQWRTLPSMSVDRQGCAAVGLGRSILVVGGGSRVVEAFDIETHTWSTLANLPSNRKYCVAGLVGNQVIVAGGEGGNDGSTAVSLDVGHLVSAPCPPEVLNVLSRRERKAALEKWVKEVTAMRQMYLGKIETETARVNAEYASKKKVLDDWYKGKMEKLEQLSVLWSNEVDEKLEDAKEQIEDLERVLAGEKSESKPVQVDEVLSMLRCPITKDVMVEPVFAADGYTYEHSAIEDLFSRAPSGREVQSPAIRKAFAHRRLSPNTAIRAMGPKYGNVKDLL